MEITLQEGWKYRHMQMLQFYSEGIFGLVKIRQDGSSNLSLKCNGRMMRLAGVIKQLS